VKEWNRKERNRKKRKGKGIIERKYYNLKRC
jgi:hypothetical protein